jgi:hypothetical protein
MALTSAGKYSNDIPQDLATRINELQTLTVKVIKPTTGAQVTAGTNIAVTGIKTTATIVFASKFVDNTVATGALASDLTSDMTVFSAGNIRFTATNWDANETGLIIYFNHD